MNLFGLPLIEEHGSNDHHYPKHGTNDSNSYGTEKTVWNDSKKDKFKSFTFDPLVETRWTDQNKPVRIVPIMVKYHVNMSCFCVYAYIHPSNPSIIKR